MGWGLTEPAATAGPFGFARSLALTRRRLVSPLPSAAFEAALLIVSPNRNDETAGCRGKQKVLSNSCGKLPRQVPPLWRSAVLPPTPCVLSLGVQNDGRTGDRPA